jgi:hypothetical protein
LAFVAFNLASENLSDGIHLIFIQGRHFCSRIRVMLQLFNQFLPSFDLCLYLANRFGR